MYVPASLVPDLEVIQHADDEHVLRELQTYGPLVAEGCYLIVEDTDAGKLFPELWGAGPGAAIEEYMKSDDSFVVDPDCEKFLLTFNPGGYLKRVPRT